jgi:hypothetical protein
MLRDCDGAPETADPLYTWSVIGAKLPSILDDVPTTETAPDNGAPLVVTGLTIVGRGTVFTKSAATGVDVDFCVPVAAEKTHASNFHEIVETTQRHLLKLTVVLLVAVKVYDPSG